MAWRYLGQSNAGLVALLKKSADIRVEEVESAMLAVDRALFVPAGKSPYADAPQSIGFNATISAPHMHAACLHHMLDCLKPGTTVLDVGSGSGYFTALIAYVMRNYHTSKVIGLEHVPELAQKSTRNCSEVSFLSTMMRTGNLRFIEGDGFEGCVEFSPYDCIHVGAAAREVPETLLDQLKIGGKIIIPLGPSNGAQTLTIISKQKNGEVLMDPKLKVSYVPLTSLSRQLKF